MLLPTLKTEKNQTSFSLCGQADHRLILYALTPFLAKEIPI